MWNRRKSPLFLFVVARFRVPRVCGNIHFTSLSPVALGPRYAFIGGTSRLYCDQATRLWSELPTDSRLAVRANNYCLTQPCRGPLFLEQAKLGTLERAGLEPTALGLQVPQWPHSAKAPRLLYLNRVNQDFLTDSAILTPLPPQYSLHYTVSLGSSGRLRVWASAAATLVRAHLAK